MKKISKPLNLKVPSQKKRKNLENGGVFNDRNFLDFSGDFSAEITDMESKIDINQLGSQGDILQDSPTASRLFSLMSGEENDQWFLERNLDRWELIVNLKDWIDQDTYRSGGLGGQEDSLYANEEPPYLSKMPSLIPPMRSDWSKDGMANSSISS